MKNKIINLFCESTLTEMPVFKDEHTDLGKQEKMEVITNDRYIHTKNKFKLIKKISGHPTYEMYMWEDFLRLFILENKKPIGFMGVIMSDFNYDIGPIYTARISSVYVFEDYQGRGLGYNMYKMIIEKIGTLMSDDTLTGSEGGGSFRMWQKLSEEYNVYVYDTSQDTLTKISNITPDLMTKETTRFVASKLQLKKNNDVDYIIEWAKENGLPFADPKDIPKE
jgi:GNAT superfamily N-acetyltransferase